MWVKALFKALFSVESPYGDFQVKPAEYLLAGRNVILQAPTGSGKTKAALFPYLLAHRQGLDFPNKMLYCVPMRVLARNFWTDLKDQQNDLDVRLQTGEQQDDPRFEGQIIFATIDQVLSSFLNIPYSLSQRQANLNAGAVVSSYLVFDEFHLLDPESTLPTTLEMLRMLKGVTPFLLMTATFSTEMLARLASLLDAEVVTVSKEELQEIPTQKDKIRRFHRVDSPLTAEAILQHHQNRSIAICNTVERAQNLFEELRKKANSSIEVILLHSRFLSEDRRQKEEKVRRLFSKDRDKEVSAILAATQVIEVGLDITCEVMHTEVAPASAILQRAGRCARFKGEKGNVYVYQVPLNQNGEPNYAPYIGQQATLCKKTWEALPIFREDNMDFLSEQRMVNLVHAEADGQMLNALEQARYAHRQEMNRAIGQQEIGLARSLIRNDDSVTILVHPNPSEIESPYYLEGFSLFFGTLHSQFKTWQESGLPNEELSWLIKYPKEKRFVESEYGSIQYEWVSVKNNKDLNASAIYVVNPFLVRYDLDVGFRFMPCGSFKSPFKKGQNIIEQRKYQGELRCENYQEHIQKMWTVYQTKLSKEVKYAAKKLEKKLGVKKGLFDLAIRLAIAFHDVGKLDCRWQRWAHEWQKCIGKPVPENYMIAHTDYDPSDPIHQKAESEMIGSLPPHAAEGAVAVFKLLHQLLGAPNRYNPHFKLMRAIFSAIARHHSPRAQTYKSFDLHSAAITVLDQLVGILGVKTQVGQYLVTSKQSQPMTSLLIEPNDIDELLSYFIVVRALRLSDQGAMSVTDSHLSDNE